jgi:hypothetical protein
MDSTSDVLEMDRRVSISDLKTSGQTRKGKEEDDEESCAAFGYLRGVKDRALTLELRFAAGHSLGYSYSLLSESKYNPSAGIMLKFLAEKVFLIVIEGSNLNSLVSGISLYDRGILRHRITYIQEMRQDQLRRTGEGEPTIDRIRTLAYRQDEEPENVTWLVPFRDEPEK